MSNPLNNLTITRLLSSPTYDFTDTTNGAQNRSALIGRVKKMTQDERQALALQLDKAQTYIKNVNNSVENGTPFYDSALCLMLSKDDELPVPKAGTLTNFFRTILHFVGARISSEDIANKIAALRNELNTPSLVAASTVAALDDLDEATQTQLETLQAAVSENGIPQVIEEVKALKQAFLTEFKKDWSQDITALSSYFVQLNSVVGLIKNNPNIPAHLKGELCESLEGLEKYWNGTKLEAFKEFDSQELKGKRLELLTGLFNAVKEISKKYAVTGKAPLVPKEIISRFADEINRINKSEEDESENLSFVEQDIAGIIHRSYLVIFEYQCEKSLQSFTDQIAIIQNTSQSYVETQRQKGQRKEAARLKAEEQRLLKEQNALEKAGQVFGELNQVQDEQAFKTKLKTLLAQVFFGLSKHPEDGELHEQLQNIVDKDFSEAQTYLRNLIEGVERLKSEKVSALSELQSVTQNQVNARKFLDTDSESDAEESRIETEADDDENLIPKPNFIIRSSGSNPTVVNPTPATPVVNSTTTSNPVSNLAPAIRPPRPALPSSVVNSIQIRLTTIAESIDKNKANESEASPYYKQIEGYEKDNSKLVNDIYGNLYWLMLKDGKIAANAGDNWGRNTFLGLMGRPDAVTPEELNGYRAIVIQEVLSGNVRTSL